MPYICSKGFTNNKSLSLFDRLVAAAIVNVPIPPHKRRSQRQSYVAVRDRGVQTGNF
jgi:hypothetical protein